MIRHCVFVRFIPQTTDDAKHALYQEIANLQDRLPGMIAVHIGSNVSPETGMDKGYADGFMVDFTDAGARDDYLADPEHQKTGAKLVAAALGGIDGVLVYDLQVD